MFNKPDNLTLELSGRKYQWDWKRWIDLKSFIEPCYDDISKLNLELLRLIESNEIDLSKLEIKDLTRISSDLKDIGVFNTSKYFIELILLKEPGDPATLAVLCSLLRKIGNPKEALKRTENYSYPNGALFTSRAAAMCDLGLWEDAYYVIVKALEMPSRNRQEAWNVFKRIKEARPELCEIP